MYLHEQALYLNWKPTVLIISMNMSCVCYNEECCDITVGRLSLHRFPSTFSTDREDMSLDLSPFQAMMSQCDHSPFLEEKWHHFAKAMFIFTHLNTITRLLKWVISPVPKMGQLTDLGNMIHQSACGAQSKLGCYDIETFKRHCIYFS
jgi:hypothetical protein